MSGGGRRIYVVDYKPRKGGVRVSDDRSLVPQITAPDSASSPPAHQSIAIKDNAPAASGGA